MEAESIRLLHFDSRFYLPLMCIGVIPAVRTVMMMSAALGSVPIAAVRIITAYIATDVLRRARRRVVPLVARFTPAMFFMAVAVPHGDLERHSGLRRGHAERDERSREHDELLHICLSMSDRFHRCEMDEPSG